MIFKNEKFIKAHENIESSYYNHSFDRFVRDAFCSKCNNFIGEQVKYPDLQKKFSFSENDKNEYVFCPFCGKKLKEK